MEVGEGDLLYLSLHCHHQNESCIKMGSCDESHFNVSAGSDGQSHKTVSTNHNLFEEKEEPKRVSNRQTLQQQQQTKSSWARQSHRLLIMVIWLAQTLLSCAKC